MALGFTLGEILFGISTVSTVYSAVQTGEATAAAKEGVAAQKRTQEISTRRERTRARAEARKARAQAVAGAQAQGAASGSAIAGATGSITSRAAAGETFLNQSTELSTRYFDAKIRETIFKGNAATFGSLGNLGLGIATDLGVFKPKPGKATTGAGSRA